uniref:fructose-bisphosphate aldolase n=1 Tax=Erythrolobus australicus TaxID=1077150 RepID=A0A7S1TLF7_9RHOD|eukprot:CAMPEP_0185832562 /NCGR_PEP_ID=MMETSP1353-20130828/2148_1 /TAXON_ID=1077150 /ORGANISM="Erythrolobus australicus, Strain CCMP3124" /LENGTH=358 /DNA_ID=CAMNT_0028530741 /DNA_START=112 /DNA_END=1188 /DNA_ORIENTATION=-
MGAKDVCGTGVVTGEKLFALLKYAQEKGFAIPSVNCTSSSTVNAALECAAKNKSPIMIQFSNGGGAFYAGKGIANTDQAGAIAGSIAGAYHVRAMAKYYDVPVVLHSDHCAKKLLPWLDGMLEEDEKYFKAHGEPLFSSHMIDLSEEPLNENIEICVKYLERMSKINCLLEMELGITGGEEDGVNNEGVDQEKLYSQPEEVDQVYSALSKVSKHFTVAAAFGNVHGVYKPGNVRLRPDYLGKHQAHIKKVHGLSDDKPVLLVFHGGSGSQLDEIRDAISHGVVKMNIDTDTQWGYWSGLLAFYKEKEGYLQAQIGNPDGEDKPNKKFYDPRVWIRKAEEGFIARLTQAYEDLLCANVN